MEHDPKTNTKGTQTGMNKEAKTGYGPFKATISSYEKYDFSTKDVLQKGAFTDSAGCKYIG